MNKIEKIILKFKNKPISLQFSDIEKILLYYGFQKIEAKGSHTKYKHTLLNNDIVVPIHNNECKNFYKQHIYKTIKNTFFK